MKVALLLCPFWDRDFPIYSLAMLRGGLVSSGHEVRILDLNAEMARTSDWTPSSRPPDHWGGDLAPFAQAEVLSQFDGFLRTRIRALLGEGVRLFGFSVYYTNETATLAVAASIKRECPEARVVLGGPQLYHHETALALVRNPSVDAVVCGEGDQALPRLVDELERTGRLAAEPGIMLREDPSTWKDARTEPVEDMDGIPFADYGGHRMSLYRGKMIHSCRGCVRKCTFCSDWRIMSYRQMSAKRMFAEVERQLSDHPDVRSFMYGDSLVNAVHGTLDEFCDLVIAADMKFDWRGFAIVRPDMKPDFLAKLRRAGCFSLAYGIETGSDKVSRDMSKPVSSALNGRVLRDTRAAGIETTVSWLVGYPSETEDDFQASLSFLRENAGGISQLGLNCFAYHDMILDGTWGRFGLEAQDHPIFWRTRDGANAYPVRVDRMRRSARTAVESGIKILNSAFAAKSDAEILALVDAHAERELESFRQWEDARP